MSAESFFVPTEATPGSWEATSACAGPWQEGLQHGGPPSALLVADAEHQAAGTRDDLVSQRVALDFLGPVPVGVIDVTSRVVRSGRSVVLVDGELSSGGRTCLRARTWLARSQVAEPTPVVDGAMQEVPGPLDVAEVRDWDFGYARQMEWRAVSGGGPAPGPAQVWGRPRIPLIPPGSDLPAYSGLQRAVLLGDSASGVSAELPWDEWSFVNIDLVMHLVRQPAGEWLMLDARTRLGPAGTGLAQSTVRDLDGVVGAGAQTLVISRRRG